MNKRKTFIPGFARGFTGNAALDADKSQKDDM